MNSAQHQAVIGLLGRNPKVAFAVCVVDAENQPVVVENSVFGFDGEPMPTRFWLVGKQELTAIGHIESSGGVNAAEAELDPLEIVDTHEQYAKARDAALPDNYVGPVPTGGVGGTRVGVKCLHAHYANWLTGAVDVVGEWTRARLIENGEVREGYVVIGSDDRTWWRG